MRITNILLILCSAIVFLSLVDTSNAQIKPGKYQIVGALNSGGGFYGQVQIKKAGPVTVKLNNNLRLKGRVDAKGNFRVTSVRGSGSSVKAKGSVSMRDRRYAISSGFSVKGEGKGIFMMGRL